MNSRKGFDSQPFSSTSRRGKHGRERKEVQRPGSAQYKTSNSSKEPVSDCCFKVPPTRVSDDDSMSEEETRGRQKLRDEVRRRHDAAKKTPSLAKRSTTEMEDTAISQQTIHNILIHAVHARKISFSVLENTNLTIAGINEFFKKYNDDLMLQWKQDLEAQKSSETDSTTAQHPQDIASQPFSVLQVAFSWARSKLRADINETSTKKKREEAMAQIKRARELYLLKQAAGLTNPKEIMASVRDTLKAESPTPAEEHKELGTTIGMTECAPQHAPTEEEKRAEVQYQKDKLDAIYCRPPPLQDDASSKSLGNQSWPVTFRKRGEPVDAIASLSPPLELPFKEHSRRRDSAVELSCSDPTKQDSRRYHKGAAAIRDKRKQSSTLSDKSTYLSEALAKTSIADAESSQHRSKSPEKKQRGTRGVARPIYK